MFVTEKISHFMKQARRVILIASKPDVEEYKQSVKITALGIAIIGAIGFVIFLIIKLIGGI
ncbi:protein translocase SEC61 complex subunit gamma [archaeon]|nr:protein translocase SEC61 complex subunit gamma [archaeon]